MENLRAALEMLDEALDNLEAIADHKTKNPPAQILPLFQQDKRRDEIIRRLDNTIEDAQRMLGEVA